MSEQGQPAKTPSTSKKLSTTTSVLIVLGIVIVVFYMTPNLSPKTTTPAAPVTTTVIAPTVSTPKVETPALSSAEPSYESADQLELQYQAILQQQAAIMQEYDNLRSKINTLQEMLVMYDKMKTPSGTMPQASK